MISWVPSTRMCACLGPQHGEPLCPCRMRERGYGRLPTYIPATKPTTRWPEPEIVSPPPPIKPEEGE